MASFIETFSQIGNAATDLVNAFKIFTDPNASSLDKAVALSNVEGAFITVAKSLGSENLDLFLGAQALLTSVSLSEAALVKSITEYNKLPNITNLNQVIQDIGGALNSVGNLLVFGGQFTKNPEILLWGVAFQIYGNALALANRNSTTITNSVSDTFESAQNLVQTWLGLSIQATSNSFPVNAAVASGGAMPTGTGMIIPSQTPDSSASYQLLDNGNGTFSLLFSNGINFNYSSALQQWFIPDANGDGGSIVYSRDTNAGVSFGDWTVQQVNASGTITSTTTLSGNIPGESLTISKDSGSNPFITGTGETTAIPNGLTTAEAMAYFEATGTPISFNDQTASVANGDSQTFTIYASSASSIAQTIKLSLTGGSGNNIIVTDFSPGDAANDAEWRMAA